MHDYLRAANTAASLLVPNPDEAAEQFMSLFLAGAQIRVMLGLGSVDVVRH